MVRINPGSCWYDSKVISAEGSYCSKEPSIGSDMMIVDRLAMLDGADGLMILPTCTIEARKDNYSGTVVVDDRYETRSHRSVQVPG